MKYTEELKKKAIAMCKTHTLEAVAEELKVSVQSIAAWKRKVGGKKAKSVSGSPLINALDREIDKLEVALSKLKETKKYFMGH